MAGLADHVLTRLEALGDTEALAGGAASSRERWSAAEVAGTVRCVAAGLADLGVSRGEHVGFIADNHDRWILADLACLLLGAVDVPRAADTSPEEVAFVLEHAGCTTVFVESSAVFDRFESLTADLPIERVIVLGGDPGGRIGWDEVIERGERARARGDVPSEGACPDDLATIVYTSGTTGNPKGVMLTHGNILHNVRVIPEVIRFTNEDAYLSFLPTWHTFERTLEYAALSAGMPIHYSSKAAVRRDLVRVRPTIVAGVPRIWEAIAAGVLGKIHREKGWRRKLVDLALASSAVHARTSRRLRSESFDASFRVARPDIFTRAWLAFVRVLHSPLHRIADRLVYAKIRAALGGRIRYVVSGGGALPLHVDELMTRAGICLLNGYGLTETSPVVCIRDPRQNVVGTSGRLLPHTNWRIMDPDGVRELGRRAKGVLWIKGPQVMRGYFRNPTATTAVLQDGWFCSGDLAALTDEDDVVICGRAKDTIVLRGGENVEPENIEHELEKCPYIADVVVVGHGEKHLAALLVPDPEAVAVKIPRLAGGSTADVATDEEVCRLLHGECGARLSSEHGFRIFERVPRIACLAEPFSVDDGTLTATMKKRRPAIEERHADLIRALFAEGAQEFIRGPKSP